MQLNPKGNLVLLSEVDDPAFTKRKSGLIVSTGNLSEVYKVEATGDTVKHTEPGEHVILTDKALVIRTVEGEFFVAPEEAVGVSVAREPKE